MPIVLVSCYVHSSLLFFIGEENITAAGLFRHFMPIGFKPAVFITPYTENVQSAWSTKVKAWMLNFKANTRFLYINK